MTYLLDLGADSRGRLAAVKTCPSGAYGVADATGLAQTASGARKDLLPSRAGGGPSNHHKETSMNNVQLIGRLTQDPVYRELPAATAGTSPNSASQCRLWAPAAATQSASSTPCRTP
jgi:hypothetical protein